VPATLAQAWPSFAKFWASLLFAFVVFAGGISWAAPPAGDEANRSRANGEQAKPAEAAPREIKFVLEDEPWVEKLDVGRTGGVPASIYQEEVSKQLPYAAIVRGFAPLLAGGEFVNGKSVSSPLDIQALASLAQFDSSAAAKRLLKFANNGGSGIWFQSRTVDEYDARIRPPRKHVEFTLNPLVYALQFLYGGKSGFFDTGLFQPAPEGALAALHEYVFLAGSVEEAKRRANDFLEVYNQAFLPRVENNTRRVAKVSAAQLEETTPKLEELEQQVAAAERELAGVEQLGEAAVSDLKVKRTLLKVELAGVEARLSAIKNKLAASKGHEGESLFSKLTELKVSADIDLASLAAQQKVLDELIDGQRRLAELTQLRERKLRPLQGQQADAKTRIERCDEILADLIPFQLVDDTVIIRPVKFELPAAE